MLKKLTKPFRGRGGRAQTAPEAPTPEEEAARKALAGYSPKGETPLDKRGRKLGEQAVRYHQKMLRRARWCDEQAHRLPLNSNGRMVYEAERDITAHIASQLRKLLIEGVEPAAPAEATTEKDAQA